MSYLKELIKRSFEVWCKMRWLKAIDKQMKLYRRYDEKADYYQEKARHCSFVSRQLLERYRDLYPEIK